MGQYFIAVNKTKKEYINPWDIGGLAKLWEWCVNSTAGLYPYLLRKSDEGGGGDINLDAPHYAGDGLAMKYILLVITTKANFTRPLSLNITIYPKTLQTNTTILLGLKISNLRQKRQPPKAAS